MHDSSRSDRTGSPRFPWDSDFWHWHRGGIERSGGAGLPAVARGADTAVVEPVLANGSRC
jgi:hypothetical protein